MHILFLVSIVSPAQNIALFATYKWLYISKCHSGQTGQDHSFFIYLGPGIKHKSKGESLRKSVSVDFGTSPIHPSILFRHLLVSIRSSLLKNSTLV